MKIALTLTNNCNLSCRHCFRNKTLPISNMPLEALDKILLESPQDANFYLTGGEPTLHPNFEQILDKIQHRKWGMVTNGQNFPQFIDLIKAHSQKLYQIGFSLDGASVSTNDSIRGQGAFAKMMTAIERARELPDSVNVVALIVVNKLNINDTDSYLDFINKPPLKKVIFAPMFPTEGGRDICLSPQEVLDFRKKTIPIWKNDKTRVAILGDGIVKENHICKYMGNDEHMAFDSLGNRNICCMFSDTVGTKHNLGNILEKSMAEMDELNIQKLAEFQASEKIRKTDKDYFLCFNCFKYYGLMGWLDKYPDFSWGANG